ncbi:MAG: transporter substrate-binding domain-containing protein [Chthoniobacterales bacterium]
MLAFCGAAFGQQQKLRVGIFERPPFAMKDSKGEWDGLAVSLWKDIAADLNLPFEFVEIPEEQAVADVAAGRVDVLTGELAVSGERAKRIKFSQPFAVFPAAVALKRETRFPGLFAFIGDAMAHGVGTTLLVMFVAMLVFSLLLWFVERNVNSAHFGGRPLHGLGSALWFAAVTMTTVGYGDKTPRTVTGRVVVFFWMFFGVVAISVFTGAVASSISVARLHNTLSGASDLAHFRNGVLDDSITQSVLSEIGIPAKIFPTVEEGLQALEKGTITAFVGGEGTLRYLVHNKYPGSIVVDSIPNTHISYAFAMRPGLRLSDKIDASLIAQITRYGWRQQEQRYIGPSAN